ncbi:MAG: hypothetical protein F4X24_02015 [Rhodobacteraceae bacterium]|nr:hypothetical protein [Paracoccaceae bacterium]
MNIFCLDSDPFLAAQFQCDKHVVKMVLESAQMLCSAHRLLESSTVQENFYKITHQKHPCTIWTMETSGNYQWHYQHFVGLCDEYRYRYDKTHLSDQKLRESLSIMPDNILKADLTPFPLALPDEYKTTCPIESYREYYKSKSALFNMNWTRREVPDWFEFRNRNSEKQKAQN